MVQHIFNGTGRSTGHGQLPGKSMAKLLRSSGEPISLNSAIQPRKDPKIAESSSRWHDVSYFTSLMSILAGARWILSNVHDVIQMTPAAHDGPEMTMLV